MGWKSTVKELKGRHLLIDAYDCDPLLLDDPTHLGKLLTGIAQSLGMEILATNFHRFEPQGVTGLLLLSTSHISIHTWPELSFAAFDLFTCGGEDPVTQIEAFLRGISSQRALVYGLDRSNNDTDDPFIWKMNSQNEPASDADDKQKASFSTETLMLGSSVERGDIYDQIERREILAGKHRMLYTAASPYQSIEVIEANDMRMYLDGQLQFSSLDERIYHEALVHPAFSYASSHERVLIVGGGDGLAVREVLKYADVLHVDLVDLDPMVLDVAKNVPNVVTLNKASLHDPRVHVHAEDAAQFIDSQHPSYQIIIVDFPDPADEVISTLYTKEFFQRLSQCLSENGVLVCQSFSPEDAPTVYWSIGLTLESVGLDTKSYHCLVPSFGDWGFHLAGRTPLVKQTETVPVPNRTLPQDIDSMFTFPVEILSKQAEASINTMDDLVLHVYYQREAGNDRS